MKKFILIVSMLFAMSFRGNVSYADYTAAYTGGDDNFATVTNIREYSTVLITKASDDPITNSDIVYVGQANDVFDASMNFMLKLNPSIGLYNVKLGSKYDTIGYATFYIGVNSDEPGDIPMTRLAYTASTEEDGIPYFTAGFELVTTCDVFSNYQTIKVGYKKDNQNRYVSFLLNENWTPEVSGDGSIMLVFVLDHIKEAELPTVSVFLSEDPLPSGSGNDD